MRKAKFARNGKLFGAKGGEAHGGERGITPGGEGSGRPFNTPEFRVRIRFKYDLFVDKVREKRGLIMQLNFSEHETSHSKNANMYFDICSGNKGPFVVVFFI